MTETAPERLSLVVFSGDYDRVHYALAMAAAAAATGRPVTMLFTMGAIHALRAEQANGVPGWAALKPAAGGDEAAMRDARHAEDGLATLEELFYACKTFDVAVRICEMGMTAERLTPADLRGDLEIASGGLVGFLAESEKDSGRIVFI
tara:strand:+ start:517 stop:960 length:444 start_codon:yes stop_codon:yes gene_type:complete